MRSHSRPALRERNPRGDFVFIATGWGVGEKYEKYGKVFAAVLASFNPTGKWIDGPIPAVIA